MKFRENCENRTVGGVDNFMHVCTLSKVARGHARE